MGSIASGQWLIEHWQLSAGIAVAALAPLLIGRALRRADTQSKDLSGLDAATQAERARVRDRRGRRVEDVLTLVVAAAAAYLSSTGLRKFGRDIMNLTAPWDWMPFVGLDLAALVCGLRARRRARKGEGAGLSGALFWVLIAISALFSASEAQDFIGGVARAAWPLISGVLFELGSLEERLTAREQLKKELGLWLERKVAAIRLLHPVEWVRVRLELAADETIGQDQATRQVRIERAGYWLYLLRRLQERADRKKGSPGRLRVLPGPRIGWADRRAQVAQARVRIEDFGLVLQAVQRRVRTREFAALNYNTPAAADRALGNFIGTRLALTGTGGTGGTERRTGTPGPDRTGTDTAASPVRTGTGQHEEADRTDTGNPVPVRTGDVPARHADGAADRTGTEEEAHRPRTDTTGTQRNGRTDTTGTERNGHAAQVTPGTTADTGPASVPDGPPAPAEQHERADEGEDQQHDTERSDEELVRALREILDPAGNFSTGGIGKTSEHFRIGTGRATRLMKKARKLGPLGVPDTPDSPRQHDADTVVFSVEQSLAQARAVSDLLAKTPTR